MSELPVGLFDRVSSEATIIDTSNYYPGLRDSHISEIDSGLKDPVDARSLEDSWRQQPSTPSYCCDYDAGTMRKMLTAAVPGVAPKKRDQLSELLGKLGSNLSHADIVAMNRKVNAVIGYGLDDSSVADVLLECPP